MLKTEEPPLVAQPQQQDVGTIAEMIESEIYRGVLAPGMWLKQIDLEERYHCTRLALRHALEQLQSRKVVQRLPNRGFYVPQVDKDLVLDIMKSRALVEASIVDELILRITDESLARLSYLASVFSETVKTGTATQQDVANHDFHRELLKSCHNSVMVEIIWNLRMRIPMAVQRANNTPARLEASAHDHFEMIEALRTRDPDRLRAVTVNHVLTQPESAA